MSHNTCITGFALKYDIRSVRDNKLDLVGPINPHTFNLKDYFDNSPWASGKEKKITVNEMQIKGKTNALNGARGRVYLYEIDLGIPPAPRTT